MGEVRRSVTFGLLAGLLCWAGQGVGPGGGEVTATSSSTPTYVSSPRPAVERSVRPEIVIPARLARGMVSKTQEAAPLRSLPAGPLSTSGRREGVDSLPAGPSAISAGSERNAGDLSAPGSTPSAEEVTSFPLMSEEQQDAWDPSDQAVEPPDTQVGVGPADLVEFDNNLGSIWSKGGALIQEFDLNSFFDVPDGYFFSSPRLFYDALSGRWYAAGMADSVTSQGNTAGSQIYVAVSDSSDPTLEWEVYTVSGNTSGILDASPMLGISSDQVVVSWNDFTSAGAFAGAEIWVLQELEMLTASSAVDETGFGPYSDAFSFVPAQSLSATAAEWVTYDDADCSGGGGPACNNGAPALGLLDITGTPEAGDVSWTEDDPTVAESYSPPDPQQAGTATTDDGALDTRLQSAVWQDGVLWTSGEDGCTPSGESQERDCLRLDEVSTSGAEPSVLQDFDAAESDADLYDPAVTMDGSGDLYVSYTASSSEMYPSAVAADQPVGASPDTLDPGFLVEGGSSDYTCSGGQLWGYYSGAAPDPAHPSDVWVAGEYAGSPSDCQWGTAAAEFSTTPAGEAPWELANSVDSNSGVNDELASVTCASVSDCWAVGDYANSDGLQSLIEQYTGSTWSVVPTASVSGAVSRASWGDLRDRRRLLGRRPVHDRGRQVCACGARHRKWMGLRGHP